MRSLLTRAAKGLYWMATPWWVRQRVHAARSRASGRASIAKLAPWIQQEQARLATRARGAAVPSATLVDLFDDKQVAQLAGVADSGLRWPRVRPDAISDRWSATRFLIDVWLGRPELRSRFPAALSEPSTEAFGAWVRKEGAVELGVDCSAVSHLLEAMDAKPAARARQAFLANRRLASILPHGLTPAGMRDLLRWFMLHGQREANLRPEEVWWLFLDAAQHPERELMLAYSFAPAWQQQHPEGSTVFGCDAFGAWFAAEYGAVGDWTRPSRWPVWHPPETQIQIAYWARPVWRAMHPHALADAMSARALLTWLVESRDSGLDSGLRDWCASFEADKFADAIAAPGLNVIGHFCYPSGLRISVESMVEAMNSVGVSTSLRDVLTDVKDDPHHAAFRGMECHDATLIHVQPEPHFPQAYARAHLVERRPRSYRIAYWYWEFATIPDSWVAEAKNVDEVWAATEFVAKGLRERLQVPVRTLFPGVKLEPFEKRPRTYFGLDEEPFTFLFTFHMMSVMERKNPLGLIRAFKKAFREGENVCLVVKTSYGDRHAAQLQELRSATEGANIQIIDAVYSPADVLALMNSCDAYVSLHRSEGLGLTLAEAMLLGKPVIATNFSGNVDFMDEGNSLLVPYKLEKLGWPIPPTTQIWNGRCHRKSTQRYTCGASLRISNGPANWVCAARQAPRPTCR